MRDLSVGKTGTESRFHLGGGTYEPAEEEDNRIMRWAIAAAVLFHVVLLFITFPRRDAEPLTVAGGNRKLYVVEPLRFQQPKPRPQQTQATRKKEVKRIPFPDPTPNDPEPIIDEQEVMVDVPEIDLDEYGDALEIPDGPPGGGGAPGSGPIWIEGDVSPPQKVFAPQPRYTEEARKARVQGVVILQAVIDSLGNVTEVEVVKGLPEGLDQSAVDTVRTWKYRPATLEGEPVAVYMNLTISFSLQ